MPTDGLLGEALSVIAAPVSIVQAGDQVPDSQDLDRPQRSITLQSANSLRFLSTRNNQSPIARERLRPSRIIGSAAAVETTLHSTLQPAALPMIPKDFRNKILR